MSEQLELFDKTQPIETIHITPRKEMPKDLFMELYRISSFMELMERTPDNKVIWDEGIETIYSEDLVECVYQMVQDDMIEVNLEVPKEFIDKCLNEE